MGLFDEIRRQIQEAIDEAQGTQPRPVARPHQAPPPPPDLAAPDPETPAAKTAADRRQQRQPSRVISSSSAPALSLRSQVIRDLKSENSLKRAIILQEVLGPPRALRPHRR